MILVYRKLFDLLDRQERRRVWLLLGLVILMALADMVGVAAILPFLAVVADPSVAYSNAWLATLREISGSETDRGFLILLGLLVFGVILAGACVKLAGYYALTRFTYMRQYTISARLLEHYLNQPYIWFLRRHSGTLSTSVLSEVDKVVGEGMIPAMRIVAHLVSLALLLGLLIVTDPMIALMATLLTGGTYGAIFVFARRGLTRFGHEVFMADRARHTATMEAFGGAKELKLIGLEEVYLRRFSLAARALAGAGYRSQIIGELPRYVLETIAFGGIILMVLALLLRGGGDISAILPVLGLYAFAALKIFPAIQHIYHGLTRLRFVAPMLDRLHAELIGTNLDKIPDAVPAPLVLRDRIELRDIGFVYEGVEGPAVEGLSITIPAHAKVGLIGGTGAGKTTVVDLVLGLLEPQSGEIMIDGVPLGPDNRRAWQRSIGYVPQHIFLTDESVAGNIAFGVPPEARDMAAIERASRLAELHDFVTGELPQGYDTFVGERGIRLSGGQRQRIGIARALYRDPDVLILDEATSALDTLTERTVMSAVENIGHAKTIIMIAHRLSTVRHCDTIFLLDRGRVAASGTFEELIESSSTFRRMAS